MVAENAHQSGDVLDNRYRLVERLGRGGFGDVWRADELLPDGSPLRQVALKLLHAHVSTAADWSEEARIIASLRHPALVTIYAAGLLELPEPRPFVAMELLLGDTLAEWVNRGERVPWRRVLSWARDTAAALDEIHRAGVVHLDLKPANLFLGEGGVLKVLDFGIARRGRGRSPFSVRPQPAAAPRADDDVPTAELEGDEMSTAEFVVAQRDREQAAPLGTATVTRSVVGTPGFMAPEILEDAEASRAADAYALAACIVQLTTGRLPQRVGERPAPDQSRTQLQSWFAEVQAATVRGQIRDLAVDDAGLPAALVALLERWLSLDPVARDVDRRSLRGQLDEVWACPQGWQGNPYRGLAPYRIEDEGRLFGRDEDIARIGRDLAHQPCVVLHGTEGIGLGSLALAGVIPELARGFVDDRDDWRPCVIPIGDDPNADLVAALTRWLDGAAGDDGSGLPADEPDVEGRGRQLTERLLEWAAEARIGVVVVITELERVLRAGEKTRSVLLPWLATLAGPDRRSGIRLLATLREEHTAELLALDECGPALRPWLRFMGPPPATIVSEIVRRPALTSGMALGDVEVVEAELQRELRSQGMRLPLASLALQRWWEACAAADRPLSGQVWQTQGGMLGAFSAHADEVLAGLSELGREKAEAVLLRLVASDGTAIEAQYDDLVRVAGGDPELARRTIDTLLGERIVLQRLDRVRLVHGKLAEAWTRLHELRLHDMDRLAFLEELRQSANRWVDAGRPKDLLWRGEKLRELGRRGETLGPDLGGHERDFIAASRRRANRRRVVVLLQVLAALLTVIVAFWVSDALERRARQQESARQQAERREAIARMVTQSRRTSDPYVRVALLAGAMQLGSDDPVLPLELFGSARGLPHATFLSLQPVPRPQFPWDGRWLVGGGSGPLATVFDFEPLKNTPWGPLVHRFRPHRQGMDDLVAFPFDSAFVTRGLDGQLRVWRLRLTGEVALAAASPMKCSGGLNAVLVAERAPVVACVTAGGLARWDLRRVGEVQTIGFQGRLLDVSPDGSWIAAARLSRLLLWHSDGKRRHELDIQSAPTLARFSPRDSVVAIVRPQEQELAGAALALVSEQALEVYEFGTTEPTRLWKVDTIAEPVSARWHNGGLDFVVCHASGRGRWHYLRKGGRSTADTAPAPRALPCTPPGAKRPQPLAQVRDYGALLAGGKRLGPRQYPGGWKLTDGRLLTRDLVLFDPAHRSATAMLEFVGRDATGQPEFPQAADSAVWVARDGPERVLWQIGNEIRQYELSGARLSSREGHVLAHCADDRVVAWRKRNEDTWQLFTARHGVHLLDLPRQPAFFVGADASCRTAFLQRANGQLVALDLTARGPGAPKLEPLAAAGGFTYSGYVYDVRPSAGSADPSQRLPPGLWLAFSSGAMVRLEGGGQIRAYGHATPRPTVMADGPRPGQLLFADRTGVILRERHSAKDRKVLDATGTADWEDMRVSKDGKTVLLAGAHRLAILDLERGEIVGEHETPTRGRLAAWDDDGSVLVWSHSFVGPAVGEIIPIGQPLSQQVARAVSNLSAGLSPDLLVQVQARR